MKRIHAMMLLAFTFALLTPRVVSGQTPASAPPRMLSVAPISALFGVYNLEFEHQIGPTTTFAVGSTYWGFEDDLNSSSLSSEAHVSYISMDLKARYYPTAVMEGFSFGGLAGITSISGGARACSSITAECEQADDREVAFSLGVEIDYNWVLGVTKQFGVVLGLGAKRLFPVGADIDTVLGYPFGRLSIGYRF